MSRLIFFILILGLPLGCATRSNQTPQNAPKISVNEAILTFPEVSAWEFRPDEAVRSANTLIAAGRESACFALQQAASVERDFSEDYKVDQKICHLCRLLFVPRRNGEALRAPGLGAPQLLPINSMSETDWPFMPFAIVQNVPLSMTLGYTLAGMAEPARNYLSYCISNGTFRTQPFPVPTATTASNALNQVLTSPAWKALKWQDSGAGWSYKLDQGYAKEMLWKQVENMTAKAEQRTQFNRSTQQAPTNAPSAKYEQRSWPIGMSRDLVRAELGDSCLIVSALRPVAGWSREASPPAGSRAARFERSNPGSFVDGCDVYWIGHKTRPKIYAGIWLDYFYFDQQQKLIGHDGYVID